ncbi:GbsR/MarR family transcriptional regulator [Microbacterium testaceum]|uniref:GbsR/MarR family transcriptional regulator n=1 Tax=Microbacterium testaceum TaxID=2033 RepID=UPI000A41A812|nr:transcriptional regulator [Microbacterium testaceum]
MTDEERSTPADAPADVLDEAVSAFVEDFAYAWGAAGNPRMEGRVLALLLIVDEPYLSSARIADLLQASAGAVSMSTRALVNLGFLKRHAIPGDRSHYFRTEDDVWGGFLAGERDYVRRINSTLEFGLDVLPEDASRPRTRLTNALRYMTWLVGHHRKMLAEWQEYRDSTLAADAQAAAEAPALDTPAVDAPAVVAPSLDTPHREPGS